MATGTTANQSIKRNRIVELALRSCRAIKPGMQVDNNLMRDGITLLNEIIREEDADQTGQKRSLHALSETHIFLAVGRYIYGTSEGLPSDVQDPQDLYFRDISGDDNPLLLISQSQYEALSPKDETGDPEKVLLVSDRVLSSQTLKVWPVPTSIGTTSVVTGTDSLNYSCVLGHTSASENRPITGASYRLFWRQTGTGGSAWATATSYTNGALIRLSYKRPLYDFDLPDDDPDLQLGWGNYLRWRLAVQMSSLFKVPLEERQWFEGQEAKCRAKLYPQTQHKSKDTHNRAVYY